LESALIVDLGYHASLEALTRGVDILREVGGSCVVCGVCDVIDLYEYLLLVLQLV